MLGNKDQHNVKCKICNNKTNAFSTAMILGKYAVSYFFCAECHFIQTEEPHWLEEAYSDIITKSDIGLIRRNLIFSKIATALISAFFDSKGRFLDYGGGYGILVRLMRDSGIDFYHYDNRCKNLFAGIWNTDLKNGGSYELLTAFEVFEHLPSPLKEIEKMLECSNNILLTTQLLPDPIPEPGSWWYYALETGQHISFYSLKTLQNIASMFNLQLYSDRNQFHLLTKKRLSNTVFKYLSKYKIAAMYCIFIRKRSLLDTDYEKLIELKQNANIANLK